MVEVEDLVRGLRPWKHTLDGFKVWCFWMEEGDKVGVDDIIDEAEAAIFELLLLQFGDNLF